MKRFASTRSEKRAVHSDPGRAQCSVGSIEDDGMRYGLTIHALIASTIAIAPAIVTIQSMIVRQGWGTPRRTSGFSPRLGGSGGGPGSCGGAGGSHGGGSLRHDGPSGASGSGGGQCVGGPDVGVGSQGFGDPEAGSSSHGRARSRGCSASFGRPSALDAGAS